MIDILPDDLPELDEEFTVTLTQVAPLETQRLRPGATEVKVIILENDNASGVFEFGEEMKTSYVVEVTSCTNSDYIIGKQKYFLRYI